MDRKSVQLQILNISKSQAQVGAFALVLSEVDGTRLLPVIIGAFEAQAMIIQIKGIVPSRPLTHRLLTSIFEALNVELNKILIYRVEEGVFFSFLYIKDTNGAITRIDARTSDAIILALQTGAPIFVYEDILNMECLKTEDGMNVDSKTFFKQEQTMSENNLETLTAALQKAIEDEDYERAAILRDQINQLNKS